MKNSTQYLIRKYKRETGKSAYGSTFGDWGMCDNCECEECTHQEYSQEYIEWLEEELANAYDKRKEEEISKAEEIVKIKENDITG